MISEPVPERAETAVAPGRWGRTDTVILAAVVAAGAALLSFRLGQGSLYDWDEATYAEIAREIGVYGDWVHLHWNFAPWFNKAPLYPWLTALAFHLPGWGGGEEAAARAVSAAAGAGILAVTYLLALRLHGRWVAIASVVVLGATYEFVAAARFGTSDGLLTFFIYASLYAFVRAEAGGRRWWYAVGALTGLALMTKDVAALVGPIAMLIALALEGRLAELGSREVRLGAGLALLIVLPWHLAQLARYGGAFLHQYIGYMVVSRATNQVEGHTGSLITYVALGRGQMYPWSYLMPFAALAWIGRWWRDRSRPSILAVFPAVVFVLYTLVRSKLSWYLVPAYPALAVLLGEAALRALKGSGPLLAGLAAAALAALVLLPGGVTPVPRSWEVALAVVLAAGAALALGRRRSFVPLSAAAVLAFLLALSANHLAPLYRYGVSPSAVLGERARALREPGPILLYVPVAADRPADDVSHSLIFYSRRRVQVVVGMGELEQELGRGRSTDLVIPAAEAAAVSGRLRFRPVEEAAPFELGVAGEPAGPGPGGPPG